MSSSLSSQITHRVKHLTHSKPESTTTLNKLTNSVKIEPQLLKNNSNFDINMHSLIHNTEYHNSEAAGDYSSNKEE